MKQGLLSAWITLQYALFASPCWKLSLFINWWKNFSRIRRHMFVFRLLWKELAMSFSFFIICLFVISTSSFPANDFLKDTGTKSHGAITLKAVHRAIATFLDRTQLVNDTRKSPSLIIFEYFGTGKTLEYDNFYALSVSLHCKIKMRILSIMKWIKNITW